MRKPSRILTAPLLGALTVMFSVFAAHSQPPPLTPTGNLRGQQSGSENQPALGTFDLDKDRQPVTLLDGPWRFHLGDDPAWANPAFDDSSWTLVSPGVPATQPTFSGTAWYRARISIPAGQGPLSLYVTRIYTSYQIFADGQMIISKGGMPPRAHPYFIPQQVLELPLPTSNQPRNLTLALRVWHWPGWAVYRRAGPAPGLRIGDTRLIQSANELQTDRIAWGVVSLIILSILEGLAGLAGLALFAFRTREREYLWFAVMLLVSAGLRCLDIFARFHTLGVKEGGIALELFVSAGSLSTIAFYNRLLEGKRNWLFWLAILDGVGPIGLIPLEYFELITSPTRQSLIFLFSVPFSVWILVLVIRRAIQGFPDARLLLVPILVRMLALKIGAVYWIAYTSGWSQGMPDWIDHTIHWPFEASLEDIADALFLIGVLAILIHRFTRTRLHEETYERERESARTIQQLLIPENYPHIPGFKITSTYSPASEVSGDFFQVIPLKNRSVLIAIGDVSGKGLPAALMVSLVVGTFRQAAESSTGPAEILAALNRRLHERSSGGFTTCLILRADPDGTLTIANAGHLSPYIEGKEIPVESGLPLGIVSDATYVELKHSLSPHESITLLTDGVIEARNPSGELFGFDRTQSISNNSAAEIAQKAKDFGQDDDITVLKLRRLPAIGIE